MKKTLLMCGVLALLLFSCKKGSKDTPTPTDEKKYPVTFNVSGFEQSYEPLGSKKATRSLGNSDIDTSAAERMIYTLYKTSDSKNYLAHRSTRKTDGDFGVYREYLAPGNYVAYFAAGGNLLGVTDNKTVIGYIGGPLLINTFYAKVPITVTSAAVNTQAELKRITSELIINIEDAIPADVKKIQLSFTQFNTFNIQTPLGLGGDAYSVIKNVTAADVGVTGFKFKAVTLPTSQAYVLTLKYYKNDLVTPFDTKVIPNVICKANYRTLVSGKLFTPKNTGFTITVDDEWDEPVNGGF